jgi:predicted phage tail protein
MTLHKEQAHAITGAVWLFGLAALFYTGRWWPGILFVIGISAIVEGVVEGKGWYAFQGGAWAIGIGIWALLNFHLWFLFVMLGVSMLLGALVPPPMLTKKPRPTSETDLE